MTRMLVAGLGIAAVAGCQDTQSDPCSEPSVAMALQGGVAVDWAGSRATVFLGDCSGVVLGPHVIATAAHCIATERVHDEEVPAAQVRLAVRGGPSGEVCLTGAGAAGCAEAAFDVTVQAAGDVALLVSRWPLAATSFATVALDGETSELRVQGFGVGSPAPGPTQAAACPGFEAARQALPVAVALNPLPPLPQIHPAASQFARSTGFSGKARHGTAPEAEAVPAPEVMRPRRPVTPPRARPAWGWRPRRATRGRACLAG